MPQFLAGLGGFPSFLVSSISGTNSLCFCIPLSVLSRRHFRIFRNLGKWEHLKIFKWKHCSRWNVANVCALWHFILAALLVIMKLLLTTSSNCNRKPHRKKKKSRTNKSVLGVGILSNVFPSENISMLILIFKMKLFNQIPRKERWGAGRRKCEGFNFSAQCRLGQSLEKLLSPSQLTSP